MSIEYTNVLEALASFTTVKLSDDQIDSALVDHRNGEEYVLVTSGTKAGETALWGSTYKVRGRILHKCDVYKADTSQRFISVEDYAEIKKPITSIDGYSCLTSELVKVRNALNKYFYVHPINAVPLNLQWYDADESVFAPHWDTRIDDSQSSDLYIFLTDAVRPRLRGGYYHREDDCSLIYNHVEDYYIHVDDVKYPVDNPDLPFHYEDLYYCDYADEYYSSREASIRSDVIQEYHSAPKPAKYILEEDVALAKYTIGFEVEKSSVDGCTEAGSYVDPEPLFAGWETDSSCGVEGITHVYSLNNTETFKRHLQASDLVDEEADSDCGGHINFQHIDNKLEYWHLKPWLGLFWSLWRRRLRNNYSCYNKKANPYQASNQKYSCLNLKNHSSAKLYELRLPNRVSNKACLQNRFNFMRGFLTCVDAYLNENWSYSCISWNQDTYLGIPHWVSTHAVEQEDKDNLKAIEHRMLTVEASTRLRIRYLLEQCKQPLLEAYGETNYSKLIDVVAYAYWFQAYIDSPLDSYSCPHFKNVSSFV